MTKATTLLSVVLLAAGCVSTQRPPELARPEVEVRQSGGASDVGVTRNLTGGMPVKLQIAVMNPSAEPIEVELIEIASVGMGAFTIPVTKRPINKTVDADSFEVIDFWTAAYAEGTIAGTGGPVSVRLTVFFNSKLGKFREVYNQNINTAGSPRIDPQ